MAFPQSESLKPPQQAHQVDEDSSPEEAWLIACSWAEMCLQRSLSWDMTRDGRGMRGRQARVTFVEL